MTESLNKKVQEYISKVNGSYVVLESEESEQAVFIPYRGARDKNAHLIVDLSNGGIVGVASIPHDVEEVHHVDFPALKHVCDKNQTLIEGYELICGECGRDAIIETDWIFDGYENHRRVFILCTHCKRNSSVQIV